MAVCVGSVPGETFLKKVFPRPLAKTFREICRRGESCPPVGISRLKFLGESENTSCKKGSQKWSQREAGVFLYNVILSGVLSCLTHQEG